MLHLSEINFMEMYLLGHGLTQSETVVMCIELLSLSRSTEIDVAFPEDPQPKYHHIFELRHTRVIWKNCLILAFTL